MTQQEAKNIAAVIDHTLLSPTATHKDIEKLCNEAVQYGFYSVCIHPRWVSLAAMLLENSNVKVCTVTGFPFGADLAKIKAASAKASIMEGADEIDMVADLAAIIDGDRPYLINDISAVVKVCRDMKPPVTLKVIIESAALTDEQKLLACHTAELCGANFIKTSTGLHSAGGATIDDVKLIKTAAPTCKVKAAGGIRSHEQLKAMLEAGAERIGTSAGVEILSQLASII